MNTTILLALLVAGATVFVLAKFLMQSIARKGARVTEASR